MRTLIRQSRRRILAITLCAVLFLQGAAPLTATPATTAIEAKRKQAEQIQATISKLSDQLEMQGEDLAQIESSLEQTRQRISATEDELARANADLEAARQQLNRRASNIYRSGPIDVIAVFVGVTDFQDFVTRLDLMRRIGRNDASLVAGVKDAKSRVESAQRELQDRESEQISLRDQARKKQAELSATVDQQNAVLATVQGELKQLVEAERQRQEQLARERAAAAAAAAGSNAGKYPSRPFDPSKLGAAHPEAVDVARRYLGVPYVWGGTSPSGFDCSGLTQYAYAQIGIDIPRTSRAQFASGAYIPPDRLDLLRPGDLLFFGTDGNPSLVHHVAMYIGDDQFIHAPQTGDVVRIASLSGRIATRNDYVGASRP